MLRPRYEAVSHLRPRSVLQSEQALWICYPDCKVRTVYLQLGGGLGVPRVSGRVFLFYLGNQEEQSLYIYTPFVFYTSTLSRFLNSPGLASSQPVSGHFPPPRMPFPVFFPLHWSKAPAKGCLPVKSLLGSFRGSVNTGTHTPMPLVFYGPGATNKTQVSQEQVLVTFVTTATGISTFCTDLVPMITQIEA